MKLSLLRAAGMFTLFSLFTSAFAHDLEVSDPWVRAAPPSAPALGVFMELENHSDTDMALVAARTSLDVDRVELHRTMKVGEVMKMVPQERIPVAANSSIRLKPGSWHVMLIGPKEIPKMDQTVTLTLVFSDGSEQQIDAVVRKGKKMMHGEGHEMKHE